MSRFHAMTTELIRRDLVRLGRIPYDALTFVIGGLFAALENWLATNCREPQSTLIQRLRREITALI